MDGDRTSGDDTTSRRTLLEGSLADELPVHDRRLSRYRGREYVGLQQATLPTLDRMTNGLRGLVVLAGGPGVGKTTLALQLGLDAVVADSDTALLFVALEFSRWDLITRLRSRFAALDWPDIMRGIDTLSLEEILAAEQRLKDLRAGDERLASVAKRVAILDNRVFSPPSLDGLIERIHEFKAKVSVRRLMVVIDSLQAWPNMGSGFQTRTDLETDCWRIDQMKDVRDAIAGDPVLVTSVASRPDEQEWWHDASASIGSERAAAAADMVLLLRALSDDEIAKLADPGAKLGNEDLRRAGALREEQIDAGFEDQSLWILKGRDAVRRGRIDLRFFIRQSRFEERARREPVGGESPASLELPAVPEPAVDPAPAGKPKRR